MADDCKCNDSIGGPETQHDGLFQAQCWLRNVPIVSLLALLSIPTLAGANEPGPDGLCWLPQPVFANAFWGGERYLNRRMDVIQFSPDDSRMMFASLDGTNVRQAAVFDRERQAYRVYLADPVPTSQFTGTEKNIAGMMQLPGDLRIVQLSDTGFVVRRHVSRGRSHSRNRASRTNPVPGNDHSLIVQISEQLEALPEKKWTAPDPEWDSSTLHFGSSDSSFRDFHSPLVLQRKAGNNHLGLVFHPTQLRPMMKFSYTTDGGWKGFTVSRSGKMAAVIYEQGFILFRNRGNEAEASALLKSAWPVGMHVAGGGVFLNDDRWLLMAARESGAEFHGAILIDCVSGTILQRIPIDFKYGHQNPHFATDDHGITVVAISHSHLNVFQVQGSQLVNLTAQVPAADSPLKLLSGNPMALQISHSGDEVIFIGKFPDDQKTLKAGIVDLRALPGFQGKAARSR